MKILQEFKTFAMRGNVVDLAVGVVIGTAFGKIVSSLVADIIMPIVGVLTGGVDFSDLKLVIKEGAKEAENVTVNYGLFIQNIVDFLIIAFSIFVVVKLINKLKKAEKEEEKPAPAPAPSEDIVLLTEIRDLLKNKN
ncbi:MULTISPECIES: large-conductance mechanosensitive channel protein MscL [unclassified Campylobacter]|uniref:large-conductance mechanosensitive channel protein MscL n=2 Tax=unclassified Campylobacter TaxID=2593542 RepID=UPI001BD92260|nr:MULTISPECIES: large-conductance mechanosensitive channel protein MscL [unclassified Campylobacter]MBT0882572.1 large-conductance mechanosensitive channel protein MscL [Campylobacter sp. 2018MI13]MBZ7976556.1 large-conductance mechanosensitive channel protein MscL [Campylobacter sp. RM12637]ULO03554.1 large conductance mechanosensitive channel protein [Campylobacter sp. RM12651]